MEVEEEEDTVDSAVCDVTELLGVVVSVVEGVLVLLLPVGEDDVNKLVVDFDIADVVGIVLLLDAFGVEVVTLCVLVDICVVDKLAVATVVEPRVDGDDDVLSGPENLVRNHDVNSWTARVGNHHNIDLLNLSDLFFLCICDVGVSL